jgi:AcrR family transcriptional regulator
MAVKNSAKSRAAKGKGKAKPKAATKGGNGKNGAAANEAEPTNRRERILEAATEEFAEKGLAGARVDEIAQKSACNKQLIYYYFKSKQGLYEEVLRRLIELTHLEQEELDEAGRRPPPWEPDGASSAYTPLWRRFWMWEALETGGDAIPREKERRAVFRGMAKQVSESQERGDIDPGFDPEMFALAVSAIREYPHIFPQLTKFYTGESPDAAKFKKRQRAFYDQLMGMITPE